MDALKKLVGLKDCVGKTIAETRETDEYVSLLFTDGTALLLNSDIDWGYYGEYDMLPPSPNDSVAGMNEGDIKTLGLLKENAS